ncbi:MAG TPA: NAD-dependent epimerase/dehydratase family protein [Solirubrobacteraceae bacterium]|nr:NAD-dependent epimerase/dehydratase family protein [Solirubrobacteraceae bacterium]
MLPSSHATDAARTGRRVLVTGGAGFIGASVAIGLAQRHRDWEVVALDNLRRRGSELNLSRLRAVGVRFEHGDVRELEDLLALGPFDALVECSAEPSVLAGVDGGADYVFQTNLVGAYNCLELARRTSAQFLFLSTSRVYPVAALEGLAYREEETRLALSDRQPFPGASARGIAESFPLEGARTLYGATKLSAELLIAEYGESYGLQTVVNRCGVVAGPWQMGKVDQGVFTYWLLAHHFGRPLEYIGFGGTGKQVRDLLHVEDLLDLLDAQLSDPGRWAGAVVNVGGGSGCSLSLRETTELCRQITGREVEVRATSRTRPGDVPIYISDCARLHSMSDWRPRRGPQEILGDIHAWIVENESALTTAL